MKILYYSPHPNLDTKSPAGYSTHMREVMNAFRLLHHDVHPVIMGEFEETRKQNNGLISKQTFKDRIKSLTPRFIWESLKDLRLYKIDRVYKDLLDNEIHSFKPDVIYERANYLQLSGVHAAREHGIPHILEINSPLVEERINLGGKTWYLRKASAVERMQVQLTDLNVVVSSTLRDYLMERCNVDGKKFLVVPNGINPSDINVDSKKKQDIIERYGLKGKKVIGFVGSFFKWHGIDLLIRAISELKKISPDISLLIVGEGSIREDLEKLALSLGEGESINFTGSIDHDEIYSYIDVMNITVLPDSHWYGSPIKLFEYGALGKPIIATDNHPVREIIEDGVDGLLTKRTAADLKSKIEILLCNENIRRELGENFRRKIFEHHTWIQVAERILNQLRNLQTSTHNKGIAQ